MAQKYIKGLSYPQVEEVLSELDKVGLDCNINCGAIRVTGSPDKIKNIELKIKEKYPRTKITKSN